ncbi:hypothetical protein [Streptomyces sp. NBC_01800]
MAGAPANTTASPLRLVRRDHLLQHRRVDKRFRLALDHEARRLTG